MAVKYLSGNRLWGTNAERLALTVVPLSDDITDDGFVWDFTWYRGANDTSGTSNSNSNKIFLSSDTLGYSRGSASATARQIGFMFSSGNNIGMMNWGTSGEAWAQLSGNVQATETTRYFRMIYDSSLNTFSWVRFAVESNRDAWTDPTDITPTGADIGYKSASVGTNFDSGDNLTYFVVESRLGTIPNASDWKISEVKFWKNQENDTGDATLNYTFPNDTNWTNASTLGTISSNVYFLDTGSATLQAYYAIPNTYPSLPNGSIFITSDTNVHYMWNGTDTWNEVA